MRRGAFAVTLIGLMLLAGCLGPSTASWGDGNNAVTVNFDRASTSFTSTLGPQTESMDGLQAVGCTPGEEDLGIDKTQAIQFTGYLAASQMYASHTDQVKSIGLSVTASAAIQSMPFKQANEMIEGEGPRVDLKNWNDPLNPQTGSGTVDLDEIDADEDSRWYILGLIPTTEHIQDGMLALGEWHQAVTVKGYLVASNTSNAYGYHSIQTVRDDCTLDVGNQNREQLFVMVTGLELDGASVTSSGDADDEWVHGDVAFLGRTGFVMMFFVVGLGGAVAAFILSKMFVMKGARDTMKVLLGQVGIDHVKKVKQDVKKAKAAGMVSPTERRAEPMKTSGGGSSVVVTEAAMEMENTVAQQHSEDSSQGNVWDAPSRISSTPTSVVTQPSQSKPKEHFTSVAPIRSSTPEPKPKAAPKKRAVRKRKATVAQHEEPEVQEQPAPQKETFQDEEEFSDFSF